MSGRASGPVSYSLQIYIGAVLLLTVAAAAVLAWRGNVLALNRPFPYNSLFLNEAPFTDLTHYREKCTAFAEGKGFRGDTPPNWIYPAPAVYLQCSILLDVPHPVRAFIAFTLALAVSGCWLIWWASRDTEHRILAGVTIGVTLATAYPLAFVIDRANMESIITAVMLLFLICFAKRRYWLAAALLAAACCIKPYSAVFFFLLLFRKRYLEIATAVCAVAAVNLFSLAGMMPSMVEAYRSIQEGQKQFLHGWVLSIVPDHIGFDHTLFSCVKQFVRLFSGHPLLDSPFMKKIFWPYTLLCAGAAVGIAFWLSRRPVLNQFFAFSIFVVLFPWLSFDYTLIQIYLPWGLFLIYLLQAREGEVSLRQALLILLPCSVVFTPQSYLLGGTVAGFGGQVKAVALCVMLGAVTYYPMPMRLFGEVGSRRDALDFAARLSSGTDSPAQVDNLPYI